MIGSNVQSSNYDGDVQVGIYKGPESVDSGICLYEIQRMR